MIVDNIDLSGDKSKQFGPVCYDDPEAFFATVGRFGLVSTNKGIYIVFYSLIGFKTTPWDATTFVIELALTPCRGFWNPCPSADMYILTLLQLTNNLLIIL